MWSPLLLPEHQKVIKHMITLGTEFSACLLKCWNRKCERTVWIALLCNLREILSLICFFTWFSCYIFKAGAFTSLFSGDRRNQRILVTMKDFIQFIWEQIYTSISIYIHISFSSAETYENQSERVFLHPVIKFCGFVHCYKSNLSFSFLTWIL